MGKKRVWFVLGALLLVVCLVAVFFRYFAPQAATMLDEPPSTDVQSGTVIKRGQFTGGDAAHEASGRVTLIRHGQSHSLRFEGYHATNGPDVFFFLSKSPEGDFDAADHVRVLVPRGAGAGQATLRGNFAVELPELAEPGEYESLIAWCVRFRHRFGWAKLTAAE